MINYSRLGMAMGLCVPIHLIYIPYAWPIKHCQICGRMEVPGHGDEFYHALIQGLPAFVCKDHFYSKASKTDMDCLTGLEIELREPVGFLRKAIGNLLIEIGYWCSVAVRYAWLTMYTWVVYAVHPRKTILCRGRCIELGVKWEW